MKPSALPPAPSRSLTNVSPVADNPKTNFPPIMKNTILLSMACAYPIALDAAPAEIAWKEAFAAPPREARPGIYYYRAADWYDSSKDEALRALAMDLDQFQAQGIGSIKLGHLNDLGLETGYHMLPGHRRWLQGIATGVKERAMTINVFNMPGWSGSGGPWIDIENTQRKLVHAKVRIKGGGPLEITLPVPEDVNLSFYKSHLYPKGEAPADYRDISIVAIKLADEHASDDPQTTPHRLRLEAPAAEDLSLPGATIAAGSTLSLTFAQSVTAASMVITPDTEGDVFPHTGRILAENADGHFRQVADFRCPAHARLTVSFPEVKSKRFQVLFESVQDQGGGVVNGRKFTLHALTLQRRPLVNHLEWKAAEIPESAYTPAPLPQSGLNRTAQVDLSGMVSADGVLRWNPPAGEWLVLRLGHVFNRKSTHPTGTRNLGYECDKLGKAGITQHFDGYVRPYVSVLREAGGDALTGVHIDSWESGSATWTADFPAEFQQRRGYDMRPFLPVLAGEIVESAEISDRFLMDYRRTIADLVADHYYGHAATLAHGLGLELSAQAQGAGASTGDLMMNYGRVDIPHSEFWFYDDADARSPQSAGWLFNTRLASSATRLYGKKMNGAESFSSWEYYREHPFAMKRFVDAHFAEGLRHCDLHVGIAQLPDSRPPGCGVTFGTAFNRHNSWWSRFKAFTDYLTRCQSMFAIGKAQGDYLLYTGDSPDRSHLVGMFTTLVPHGHGYYFINSELLLDRIVIKDGRFTSPAGYSYPLLVLPNRQPIPLPVLQKIEAMVNAGGTILGQRPTDCGGLTGYPQSDEQAREIVERLWQNPDQPGDMKTVGKGCVILGQDIRAALNKMGIRPDFEPLEMDAGAFRFRHHRDGETDIYWLVNQTPEYVSFDGFFRVRGKVPVLLDPVNGSETPSPFFQEQDDGTIMPLSLPPYGAVFVVFEPAANRASHAGLLRDGQTVRPGPAADLLDELSLIAGADGTRLVTYKGGTLSVPGRREYSVDPPPPAVECADPWKVDFTFGKPATVVFPKLISWTNHDDPEIRHYSGEAVYSNHLEIPAGSLASGTRAVLDLCEVLPMAEIFVNGESAGILWCPPFRLDLTGRLREGRNELRVAVINTWFNRLARDVDLPPDQRVLDLSRQPTPEIIKAKIKDQPLMKSGLLGPVRIVFGRTVPLDP